MNTTTVTVPVEIAQRIKGQERKFPPPVPAAPAELLYWAGGPFQATQGGRRYQITHGINRVPRDLARRLLMRYAPSGMSRVPPDQEQGKAAVAAADDRHEQEPRRGGLALRPDLASRAPAPTDAIHRRKAANAAAGDARSAQLAAMPTPLRRDRSGAKITVRQPEAHDAKPPKSVDGKESE